MQAGNLLSKALNWHPKLGGNGELSSQGTMWKALNMAADSLINGFLIELGGLEARCGGILD
jgi:hypothetical protein